MPKTKPTPIDELAKRIRLIDGDVKDSYTGVDPEDAIRKLIIEEIESMQKYYYGIVIPDALRVADWESLAKACIDKAYPGKDNLRLNRYIDNHHTLVVSLQQKRYKVEVALGCELPDHKAFWDLYTTADVCKVRHNGYHTSCEFTNHDDAVACYEKLMSLKDTEIYPLVKRFEDIEMTETWYTLTL